MDNVLRNPFRLALAHGKSFCNREREKELLARNMLSGIHTVVYAPRRYGKSSLARELVDQVSGLTWIYVDLFSVSSFEDVAEKIYRSIVNTLGYRSTDKSSFAARLSSVFKRLRLGLEFAPDTGLPEFTVSLGDVRAEIHLEEVTDSLDRFCESQSVKVCLVLDEFQEICNLRDSPKIEALLRGGMQAADHVSFLIMGSRRTLLRDMFEDRKRPFYKSAYVLELPRIPEDEFTDFLISRFASSGQALDIEEASALVSFVDAYPYYVQKLAMLYFDISASGGTLVEAETILLEMESADCGSIYIGLTTHQKQLLKAIARSRPTAIFSQSFLAENRLGSQGGVQTSLAKLKKLDLVEQRDKIWKVVDPVFERWLRR